MKKELFTILLILLSLDMNAETIYANFGKIKEFKVGSGKTDIQYQASVYMGSSPNGFAFYNGHSIWIGEISEAKIFDIDSGKISMLIKYPIGPSRAISSGSYHIFCSDYLFVNNSILFSYKIDRSTNILSEPIKFKEKRLFSRLYLIKEYLLYYNGQGDVCAIDPKNQELSSSLTLDLLLEWINNSWYQDENERVIDKKLVSTGKYIIADHMFYPLSCKQMLGYYSRKGLNVDSMLLNNLNAGDSTTPPIGVSLNGDIYLASVEGIFVVDQKGTIAAIIDDNKINPRISDPEYSKGDSWHDVSPLYYTVHPNGDVYTLYAIKNKTAHLFRAEKTWGNDLIKMARNGVKDISKEKLNLLSNIDLMLLKNALFAIHGYEFTDFELLSYFYGYSWYKPNRKIKYDATILTKDQKQLFELIIEIEKDRSMLN